MKKILCTSICFLATACMNVEPPSVDSSPPTVVEFLPNGDKVPPDTDLSVLFSEPVVYGTYPDGLIVLVAGDDLNGALLADIDKPPLSSSRIDIPIDCNATIDLDGRRILLDPLKALEPGQTYVVVVSAAVVDLAGNKLVDELAYNEQGHITGTNTHILHEFTISAGGVVITEIMANPAGTESQGEYIEIANTGFREVDLRNWRIDDSGGEEAGDRLGPCDGSTDSVLSAGAVALLVGGSFIEPVDLTPGTLLLCTDHATLTSRGLRNTGEEILRLSDSDVKEIDRYGGWIDFSASEGCSAVRIDLGAEDGPGNWIVPEDEPCRSPGWVEGSQ